MGQFYEDPEPNPTGNDRQREVAEQIAATLNPDLKKQYQPQPQSVNQVGVNPPKIVAEGVVNAPAPDNTPPNNGGQPQQ